MNMKNQRPKVLTAIVLSALALTAFGCSNSDRDPASDKVEHAYDKTKAAVSNGWSDLKDYTFEKSSDFKDRAAAMSSDLDAKLEKLKADTADAKASASRSAAWEEVKSSRADLSDKLDALGNASADTWDSAKANVIAAAKRVEAAYEKLKADMS